MFSFSSKLYYDKRRVNAQTNEASLFLMVIIDGKHKPFALKLRWPADKIDLLQGKLLPRSRQDNEVHDYNLLIASEIAKHTEIHRAYRIRNENLTLEKFKIEVHVFNERESFISYMERERNTRFAKGDIDTKTWQNVHAVKMQVMEYDPISSFKNIDSKWMQGFKNFLTHKEFREGEFYKAGTIWDRVRTVKTYLNRASEEPMIFVNDKARRFANKKPQDKTVFLNKEEVKRLIIIFTDHYLPPVHQQVLGAFLFCCFTSMRISDVYRVENTWEVRDGILRYMPYKNRKSRKIIEIPIVQIAKSFVQRYTAGNFFDLPTGQAYNRIMKQIALKAEISKNLSSHVARHTFGHLYMITEKNIYGLKEILGHTKIETTLRYAHLDEEYKVDSVKKIENEFSEFQRRLRIV